MTYPGLFSRYDLSGKGRAWIKNISPEDRAVFVQIGLEETGHGQKGGRAIYMQKGRGYMAEIGRRGAAVTNAKKAQKKAYQEELASMGVTFDY